MNAEQLRRLHELVHAAQAVVQRPFEEGETSRPIEFFTDHLPDEGWRLGWILVAALRAENPELFSFYAEQRLHQAALDCVLEAPSPLSLNKIVAAVRTEAESETGDWLVSIPIANASLDRPWAPAGPAAALRRTHGWRQPTTTQQEEADGAEAVSAEFDVYKHLEDRLSPDVRMFRVAPDTVIDTKRLVTLLVVESGARPMALQQARAKAHYAIAAWSVLSPPERWHLLPDIATWFPQPDTHHEIEHKRLEPGEWIGKERTQGRALRQYAPYELPDDGVLAAPFEAFAKLDKRAAQALLTSTAAYYVAARGSRSQLSAQVREVRRSIECLCEPVPGSKTGSARKRWKRLSRRCDVWKRVTEARAYTPQSIGELQSRLINARNIGTHGADAALLDLGWTAGDRPLLGGKVAEDTDLSLAALNRDLSPALFAVGEALRAVWQKMREADFDETEFEKLFVS
jgi:hypothetical protein